MVRCMLRNTTTKASSFRRSEREALVPSDRENAFHPPSHSMLLAPLAPTTVQQSPTTCKPQPSRSLCLVQPYTLHQSSHLPNVQRTLIQHHPDSTPCAALATESWYIFYGPKTFRHRPWPDEPFRQ